LLPQFRNVSPKDLLTKPLVKSIQQFLSALHDNAPCLPPLARCGFLTIFVAFSPHRIKCKRLVIQISKYSAVHGHFIVERNHKSQHDVD
jgi:hypothetical protein